MTPRSQLFSMQLMHLQRSSILTDLLGVLREGDAEPLIPLEGVSPGLNRHAETRCAIGAQGRM